MLENNLFFYPDMSSEKQVFLINPVSFNPKNVTQKKQKINFYCFQKNTRLNEHPNLSKICEEKILE